MEVNTCVTSERVMLIVRAGFDEWAVKPCGKAKITKLVEKARKKLLGIMEEPDPEMERRYTI